MNEWLTYIEPGLTLARTHARPLLDAVAGLPPWVPYAALAAAVLGWLRAWTRARRGERGIAAARLEAADWQGRYEREAMWRKASAEAAEAAQRKPTLAGSG